MEGRFGADFDAVRIHTDPNAAHLDALAYTVGTDIFFAPGRFQPGTANGDLLLAHELTHVMQQRDGAPALGIHRAPPGLYRWMAGGCCVPGVSSPTIGTMIHGDIEALMYGLNPFMQAEVPVPGAAAGGTGFVDLYLSVLPFLQPVGSVSRMPGRVGLPFPPAPAPKWAGLGSIKPITFGAAAGHLDLMRYVSAFNSYYTTSGGTGLGGTQLPHPTNPAWLIPGVPFVHAPLWLPQDLHIFSLLDGMYWYFCTPSLAATALAVWLARYIAQKLRDFLDEIGRILQPVAEAIARVVMEVVAAIGAALEAVAQFIADHWLEILLVILLVVAVVLIIIFWEVIVAFIAGLAAALLAAAGVVAAAAARLILAALAEAATALGPALARTLAGGVAAAALALPQGARAAAPADFTESSAPDIPPIPGGLRPQQPLPAGGSGAQVNIDDALALLNRASALDPHAVSSGVSLCDEAQRMARAFANGGAVVGAFQSLKGLLQRVSAGSAPAAQTPGPQGGPTTERGGSENAGGR
jgi:hypothetical protein